MQACGSLLVFSARCPIGNQSATKVQSSGGFEFSWESNKTKLLTAYSVPSHPFHKAVHHPLLASLVELHDQLVAVDRGDVAVAEFLVEHAIAHGKGGDGAGRFGDQLAFDGERKTAPRLTARAAMNAPSRSGASGIGHHIVINGVRVGILVEAAPALRALPARRAVARAEMGHLVETRGAGVAVAGEAAFRRSHLHMRLRQLVEEARG